MGADVVSPDHPRVDVLGTAVSAITMADALATLARWIERRESHYVCVVPAHTVMDCRDDPALADAVNRAGLVTPDGMSLVWLLRLRGHRRVERVYGPDLLLAACERSLASGWRHYFLGGDEGVADELVARLRRRYPGLAVAGASAPVLPAPSAAAEQETLRAIDDARPDIVWIALGSPKQERWMAVYRSCLAAPVLVGVGAAFDFLTGRRRQAPRWVQRSGLEWLFRLGSEPGRLWRRYARYPRFAYLALRETVLATRDGRGTA